MIILYFLLLVVAQSPLFTCQRFAIRFGQLEIHIDIYCVLKPNCGSSHSCPEVDIDFHFDLFPFASTRFSLFFCLQKHLVLLAAHSSAATIQTITMCGDELYVVLHHLCQPLHAVHLPFDRQQLRCHRVLASSRILISSFNETSL